MSITRLRIQRIRKSMPLLFWWIILTSVFDLVLLFLFNEVLILVYPISIIIAYILRFSLVRRRVYWIFAILLTLAISLVPISLAMRHIPLGSSALPPAVLILTIVIYKLLRIENLNLQEENSKSIVKK